MSCQMDTFAPKPSCNHHINVSTNGTCHEWGSLTRGEAFTLQWQSAANASRIVSLRSAKSFSKYNRPVSGRRAQAAEAANYKYLSSSMRNRRKLHARRNVNACSSRRRTSARVENRNAPAIGWNFNRTSQINKLSEMFYLKK